MSKIFTISQTRNRRGSMADAQYETSGTLAELIGHFNYTLDKGRSWQHEKGNVKINTQPKSAKTLVKNLNNAVNNSAANGYAGVSFKLVA